MTAPASRWAPRVPMLQVKVTPVTPTCLLVESRPPLYAARVVQRRTGVWVVDLFMSPGQPNPVKDTHDAALKAAGEVVARAGGALFSRFNAQQRYAMGQQRCPTLMGGSCCGQPAGVGTVWCDWHPEGRQPT